MFSLLSWSRRAIATVAFAAVSFGAQAADLYGTPAYTPAVVSAYNWVGPYLGLNAGYQWNRVSNNGSRPRGFEGGIQGGYNWQSGQFVLGLEADLQLSGADDRFAAWKFSNPWFGTLRGRAGVAMNNILFFGTFGFALAGARADSFGLFKDSRVHAGWAAGGGIEVGLTPNWSARAEYLYFDMQERSFAVTGASNGLNMNVFRLGVNYRF